MWPIKEKENRQLLICSVQIVSLEQAAGMSRYGSLFNINPSALIKGSLCLWTIQEFLVIKIITRQIGWATLNFLAEKVWHIGPYTRRWSILGKPAFLNSPFKSLRKYMSWRILIETNTHLFVMTQHHWNKNHREGCVRVTMLTIIDNKYFINMVTEEGVSFLWKCWMWN